MAESVEALARMYGATVLAALKGVADSHDYVDLPTFDRIMGKYGLMDPTATNGEAGLARHRAKSAMNAALERLDIAERLLSVSGSDELAENKPDGRSILIAQPVQSFTLETGKRRQRLRNAMGRAETVLKELRDVAATLDAQNGGVNAQLVLEMGQIIGVFSAARGFVEYQLDRMSVEAKPLLENWDDATPAPQLEEKGGGDS